MLMPELENGSFPCLVGRWKFKIATFARNQNLDLLMDSPVPVGSGSS